MRRVSVDWTQPEGPTTAAKVPSGTPMSRLSRTGSVPAFFFSSRRRHTRFDCDWSSDVCSSDLGHKKVTLQDRANIAKANALLCRRFWAGEKIAEYKDDYYEFKDVELRPTPSKNIPIWYGGGTPASCRRAADYCDGWMPGRIPTATFNKMVKYLEEQCKLAGRPMVTTGAIPITSIDKNRDVALGKVNTKGLINEGNSPSKKTW